MITAIAALLLIILFISVEGRLRQGDRAKSLDAGEADRGSTQWIGRAFGLSMALMAVALVLDIFKLTALPDGMAPGWAGLAIMLAGIGLRVWSARTLGRFYTRTLLTEGDQRIVRDGPYRLIRHPGYLGMILLWVGAALAAANWVAVAVIPVVTLAAYVYRIRSEEDLLAATFGEEFQDYRRHTWRLVPLLY